MTKAKSKFIYSESSQIQRLTGGRITIKCGPSAKSPGIWVVIAQWPAGISNFPDIYRFKTKEDAEAKAEAITKQYQLERA